MIVFPVLTLGFVLVLVLLFTDWDEDDIEPADDVVDEDDDIAVVFAIEGVVGGKLGWAALNTLAFGDPIVEWPFEALMH